MVNQQLQKSKPRKSRNACIFSKNSWAELSSSNLHFGRYLLLTTMTRKLRYFSNHTSMYSWLLTLENVYWHAKYQLTINCTPQLWITTIFLSNNEMTRILSKHQLFRDKTHESVPSLKEKMYTYLELYDNVNNRKCLPTHLLFQKKPFTPFHEQFKH